MEETLRRVAASELWRIKSAAMDDYDHICDQVNAGQMEFFAVGQCYFVTFAEPNIKELVIACAEGEGVKQAADVIYQAAKHKGYKTIRFHTYHKGLHRLVNQYPWRQGETIYRLDIEQ